MNNLEFIPYDELQNELCSSCSINLITTQRQKFTINEYNNINMEPLPVDSTKIENYLYRSSDYWAINSVYVFSYILLLVSVTYSNYNNITFTGLGMGIIISSIIYSITLVVRLLSYITKNIIIILFVKYLLFIFIVLYIIFYYILNNNFTKYIQELLYNFIFGVILFNSIQYLSNLSISNFNKITDDYTRILIGKTIVIGINVIFIFGCISIF